MISYNRMDRNHSLCHYIAVNGRWSNWGGYGTCSKSCGTGRQTKIRTCTNPAPAYGGSQCRGLSSNTISCKIKECPGMFLSYCFSLGWHESEFSRGR